MRKRGCAFLGTFFVFLSCADSLFADYPWDKPFHPDPKAVLEGARAIPAADAGLIVLLDEYRIAIDDAGRCVQTHREVFRVVDKTSVADAANVERVYAPWHQSRSDIRGRVISDDGQVHLLDPKTIADAPVQQFDATIFSDDRQVRAPLPAVAPGAVVEYEVTIRDTAPLLDAGVAVRISIQNSFPVERFRVTLIAPAGLALQTASGLLEESAIHRQTSANINRIEVDAGPFPIRKNVEWDIPSEFAASPYFAYATGRSWQAIATRYEAIVNQQLQGSDLRSLLEGIDLKGKPLDVAARLSARLHKEIRYTGVEFGKAAIVPTAPGEVLKRKYGDCKDKSALLVALLRTAGLNASVALLSSGPEQDVDAGLPGFGQFNHAIVYVAGESPFWIDATASKTRIGDLPPGDQGRMALVARRETTSLVRTPESTSSDNRVLASWDIRLNDTGPADVREVIEATGWPETYLRENFDASDPKKLRETLDLQIKERFLAKTLGEYEAPGSEDFSRPFKLSIEAKRSRIGMTSFDDGAVVVNLQALIGHLPYALVRAEEADDKPRQHDFVFHNPYQSETRYHIVPPPLFKIRETVNNGEFKIGTATYSRKIQVAEDGSVDITLRFDSGKRRISPVEFEAVRKGLQEHFANFVELITLSPAPGEEISIGNMRKGLAIVREYAEKHPQSSSAHIRLSRSLLTAGDGSGSLAEAKKAVELSSGPAPLAALSWAYQHDSFGRRMKGNWKPEEADRNLRSAAGQAPDDIAIHSELAGFLHFDLTGEEFGSKERLEDAVKEYREILKIVRTDEAMRGLLEVLMQSGQVSAVKDELRKLQPSGVKVLYSATATALTDGSTRAILEVQKAFADDKTRGGVLALLALNLIGLRHYHLANDVLVAITRIMRDSTTTAQVASLSKLKRWEDGLLPATDPIRPVQELIVELASAQPDDKRIRALFTKDHDWTLPDPDLSTLRVDVSRAAGVFVNMGVTYVNRKDAALAAYPFTSEGDDEDGYRITRGTADETSILSIIPGAVRVIYVVKEEDHYRILCFGTNPAEAGKFVFALLKNDELRNASDWLDRITENLPNDSGEGRTSPAGKLLWSGVQKKDAALAEIVAAAIVGRYSPSEKAIGILDSARSKKTVNGIDVALCDAYEAAAKWTDLAACGRRVSASPTYDTFGFRYEVIALTNLRRWDELYVESLRWQKIKGAPRMAYRAAVTALIRLDRKDEALKAIGKMQSAGGDTSRDRTFEARSLAALGKTDDKVIDDLVKERFFANKADDWYVFGMLQALQGKPDEAQKSLLEGLSLDDFDTLGPAAWALHGKILELYGAPGAAAAYERARTIPSASEIAEWALAVSRKP